MNSNLNNNLNNAGLNSGLNSGLNNLNNTGLNNNLNNLNNTGLNTGVGARVETIVRDAKLVEERIHQHEEQHVQPLLTRDIVQKEVHQVLQPMHETTVLPTQHATGTLQGEDILINNDRAVAPQLVPEAVRIAGETNVNIVQHAPIVEERFHKKIIEEVQPVLYRDVIQNKETIITQPIHERIIEAPIVIQETRGMVERGVIELGTTGGLGLNQGAGLGYQGTGGRLEGRLENHLENDLARNQGTGVGGRLENRLEGDLLQHDLNRGAGLNTGLNQGGLNSGLNQGTGSRLEGRLENHLVNDLARNQGTGVGGRLENRLEGDLLQHDLNRGTGGLNSGLNNLSLNQGGLNNLSLNQGGLNSGIKQSPEASLTGANTYTNQAL